MVGTGLLDLERFRPEASFDPVLQCWTAVVPVSVDHDQNCFASYRCLLLKAPELGNNFWEFKFEFYVAYMDESQDDWRTLDRNMAIRIVPEQLKDAIIPAICKALAALVSQCKPKYIYRVANGSRLPEKALAKHHTVTTELVNLGYRVVETGLDSFHRPYWLMMI